MRISEEMRMISKEGMSHMNGSASSMIYVAQRNGEKRIYGTAWGTEETPAVYRVDYHQKVLCINHKVKISLSGGVLPPTLAR